MSNENEYKSVGAVILAAGFSSRMKMQKSFLKYDDNRVFIQKIIDNFLEFGCHNISITYNATLLGWSDIQNYFKENQSIHFVPNQYPEYERFYSIKTGLNCISDSHYSFIQNVDNPFIESNILNAIYKNRTEIGFTVPVYNGKGGHPILLAQDTIIKIREEKENNLNFKEFLGTFYRKNVEVETDKIHININTEEDYNNYFPNHQLSTS